MNHGNANVERGFSKNKLLLTSHRTRLTMPRINGLRTVSSYMKRFDNKPQMLPYSEELISNTLKARSAYMTRIERERRATNRPAEAAAPNDSQQEVQILAKKRRAEALLAEGMTMLDNAVKGESENLVTKVAAANATIQNAEKLLDGANKELNNLKKEIALSSPAF